MIGHFEMDFAYLLGLTNPCPTAVLHFGLQKSDMNICYYHQDLH